jgi:hypothetical protein
VRRARSGELCWWRFLGSGAEARACANEAQRLDPILTIEWLPANSYSKEPEYLCLNQRAYERLLRRKSVGAAEAAHAETGAAPIYHK